MESEQCSSCQDLRDAVKLLREHQDAHGTAASHARLADHSEAHRWRARRDIFLRRKSIQALVSP